MFVVIFIIVSFAVFIGSFSSVYGLIKLAPSLRLLAVPGGHRKHQNATPMVGGIAIYIGLIIGCLGLNHPSFGLMCCLTLMCFVGALDDRYALPSIFRFFIQGLIVYLMIRLTGVQLHSLGTLFSSKELLLGNWSIPLTIFACIGVINAINMSDGLDGLAGSIVFIVMMSLLLVGSAEPVIIISLFSIAGFLTWNLRIGRAQARAFLGDAGSTMLGLLLAYLLIKYSQSPTGFTPVTALWILALPLIDAVAVLVVRPLNGKSPFQADRLHYHHQLIDRGLSVNKVLLIALITQGLFIFIGLWMWQQGVNENIQLILFLILFFVYLTQLHFSSHKK